MNERGKNEPEHDAWLRAALAHAPDAGIGAPPALSEAILRAAAGPRPAARPSPWRRLMDAWSWLARPPVAAGFASVMVAGVVGLMWWERPMEEVMPRSPVLAEVPAPLVTVAPAEPRSSAVVAARATPPPAVEETAKLTRQVASSPTAMKPAAKVAPADAAVRRESAPQAAATAATAAPPAAEVRLPAAPPTERSMDREDVRPRRAESAAADPAPVMSRRAAPAPTPATADERSAERLADRMMMQAPPAASERAHAAARAASPARAELAESASAASPLAPLLSRWPATADTWRWRPPDASAPQPADAAAQAWLQRVEQATRGRWSARAETAAEAAPGGPTVTWWQGDVPLGTLQFLPDGLAWRGADGRRAWAPLDAETLAALRLN